MSHEPVEKTDYGLVIAIFILVPLFTIKLSQTMFAIPLCTQADLEENIVEKCEFDRRTQMDAQYLTSLIIGAFFVALGYALYYFKLCTKSPALGCIYGGMSALVYSVYANYNRLENEAQMGCIGLILVCMIFLPSLTHQILVV
jgi:hypothetical protein